MALTIAFSTWMCIISRNIKPTKLDQCMVGLFRTPKLANNSYYVSYSNIGHPWARLEIKPSIEPIFNPFIHKFVYLGQNWIGTPLDIQLFVFQMGTIFCNVGPTFFHPKPQQVSYNNPMAHVFCENIPFTPNNLTLVLNQSRNKLYISHWEWTHFLQLNLMSMST